MSAVSSHKPNNPYDVTFTDDLSQNDIEFLSQQTVEDQKTMLYCKRVGKIMTEDEIDHWVSNVYYKDMLFQLNDFEQWTFQPFNKAAVPILKQLIPEMWKYKININSINQFLKWHAVTFDGFELVPYYKTTKYSKNGSAKKFGRLQTYKVIGLNCLKRQIRATLLTGVCFELDQKNAQPHSYKEICKQNNLKCNLIKKYCKNREKYLRQQMKMTNCSRSQAKDLFISVLFGKKNIREKHIDFVDKLIVEFQTSMYQLCKLHHELYDDMLYTAKINFENQSQIYEKLKSKGKEWTMKKPYLRNAQAKTVAYLLHNIENEKLQNMKKACVELEFLKDIRFTSNVFDGCFIPIDQYENVKNSMNKLTQLIEKLCNIECPVDVKKFDKECLMYNKILQNIDVNKVSNYNKTFDMLMKECRMRISDAKEYWPIGDPEFKFDSFIQQQRLPNLSLAFQQYHTFIIRSNMGTGKTYQLKKYLQTLPEDTRILIVSFRRSLERKYFQDFDSLGFILYENDPNRFWFSEIQRRFIVQIDSLWKISGSYDLIIFDEISYTLDTWISFSQNKKIIEDTLNEYLETTPKCIAMDAFMTNENVNWLRDKRKSLGSEGFHVLQCKNNQTEGEAILIEKKTMLSQIKKFLINKKKLVIASSSESFLIKMVKPMCDQLQCKSLFITADMEYNPKNLDEWVNYDVVAYTPTISAGLSFDVKNHFDYRLGYFVNKSAPAEICAQMLFRVRHTVNNKIYISTNIFGKISMPTHYTDIEKWLNDYINIDKCETYEHNMREYANLIGYSRVKRKFNKNSTYHLVLNTIKKKNLSNNFLINRIMWLLQEQAWEIKNCKIINKSRNQDVKKDIEELKLLTKNWNTKKRLEEIKKWRDLAKKTQCTKSMYKELKTKKVKSVIDKIIIKIYELSEFFGHDISKLNDDEILCILRNKNTYTFQMLFNQQTDFKESTQFAQSKILQQTLKDQINYFNQKTRDWWMKSYHSLMFMHICGYENINKLHDKFEFNQETLSKVFNHIKVHWEQLKALYNLPKTLKSFVTCYWGTHTKRYRFLQKMFKHIGLKMVPCKNNRKRINGRRIRTIKKYLLSSTLLLKSNIKK